MKTHKETILIIDDAEINRSLLIDMLGNEYFIIEAVDGKDGLDKFHRYQDQIDLILLDLIMPQLDGFQFLEAINQEGLQGEIPVILISADDSPESIDRAYSLGATDYINRPFNLNIVSRRVENTILLYKKQNALIDLINLQINEKEKRNAKMINVLSTAVEFRNGELSSHILTIREITKLLIEAIIKLHPQYNISKAKQADIINAAALHDLGKISIPENIINKPGRLTKEEFEIMKTHSLIGAQMIEGMHDEEDDDMISYAKEIAHYHHERYDGKGYPEGLKGDEIPFSAQVVSIADVYDSLTSGRVYKPPYSHEKSMHMIKSGECGVFNPILIEALNYCDQELQDLLHNSNAIVSLIDSNEITRDIIENHLEVSSRSISLFEEERTKFEFLTILSNEVLYDYNGESDILKFSGLGYEQLGLPMTIPNFSKNRDVIKILPQEILDEIIDKVYLNGNSVDHTVKEQYLITLPSGETKWYEFTMRTIWSKTVEPQLRSVIGKMVDVNNQKVEMNKLHDIATKDSLTKLYNRQYAKTIANQYFLNQKDQQALVIFLDIDKFKNINDTRGHSFGDKVLKHIGEVLLNATRNDDIVCRIGGDEFIVVFTDIKDKKTSEMLTQRIFENLCKDFDGYPLSVSIGTYSNCNFSTE